MAEIGTWRVWVPAQPGTNRTCLPTCKLPHGAYAVPWWPSRATGRGSQGYSPLEIATYARVHNLEDVTGQHNSIALPALCILGGMWCSTTAPWVWARHTFG